MVVVRGVNVYPSAVEEILRQAGGVAEYRVEVNKVATLAELAITIETAPGVASPDLVARSIEDALHRALSLRVPVKTAPAGTLPRFELKAKRWIHKVDALDASESRL